MYFMLHTILVFFLAIFLCLNNSKAQQTITPSSSALPSASSSPIPSSIPSSFPSQTSTGIASSAPTQPSSNSPTSVNSTSTSPIQPVNNTNSNFVIGLPTSASVPYTAPAAYVSFITPTRPAASEIPLYSANSNITLVWGYDQNLKVQPVSLTLCAVPTDNTKYTYTITQMPGYQTSAVWDTAPLATGGAPLQNGQYQIQLFDQRGLKGIYSPGWMVAATQLTIGIYNAEPYTPYSNPSTCATCYFENNFPKDTFIPLATTFGIALLTTFSFLWFTL